LPDSISQAQPPLDFVPPQFNPLVYQTARTLLPAWMRWRIQLTDVQVHNPAQLAQLYDQFQAKQVRFMMAFRHPSVNDPFSLLYLLSRNVPEAARQQGIALAKPVHAHFIYDRGIPLWAGKPVGWFISQMGATPIRRGKVDLPGLRSIRQLFLDGQFPMAAAPEGATNGHAEIVSPIEPGIAQFGFWCAEDLRKANRNEQVLIVPIGMRYRYVSPPWEAIEHLLGQLEADCGLLPVDPEQLPVALTAVSPAVQPQQVLLYRRLLRLGEYLLTLMEKFYSKFYHQNLQYNIPATASFNDRIAARLETLLNASLSVTEQYFGLQSKGTVTDRCRRIEQTGWDWIFREDLDNLAKLPPTERGLADRIAEEADLRLWHMRLVETFVSVTGHYILEKPTVDRLAETLLLVWDTVTRLKGHNPIKRPRLGQQRVEITIDQPISISERYPAYQTNRRQAVATLTQDLQSALEALI
jgi:1-acyl-sn-glycerol-3-phosphate acyltransferase